jgi:amino acid adenylation domain-containing protein
VSDDDLSTGTGSRTIAGRRPVRALHELIVDRARRTPRVTALTRGDRRVDYGELVTWASAVARDLCRRGVPPEQPVGVCADRSPEMVAALLGTFMAGAAYLPLDPSYPRERISYMLRDSGARLVLVTENNEDLFRHGPAAPARLCPPPGRNGDASKPGRDALPTVPAGSLAYMIYTSGSTGRPKGVGVPHHGLVNLALAQAEVFGLGPGDRVLQFSSPCFDASIFETVMALTSGATLCLADPDDLLPGEPLGSTLAKQRITVVTLPPTCLGPVPPRALPDLQTIAVAGEVCPIELVRAWATGRRFLNLYGPTEATIWSTTAECRPGDDRPPIGRPIDNVTAYVLDERMEPVPPGVSGELYVGGAGVARGYVGLPALTAARFVPDPFSQLPGARLYRTGDLARSRPDGAALEFVGRIDDQVKIRGFRIEPNEVRMALADHPAVRECAVVARRDSTGDEHLVGYLVARDAAVSTDAIRSFLARRLPEHMVPTAFMWLPQLPIGLTGKLDHRALPEPDAVRPELDAGFIAPQAGVEQRIAAVFGEILGVDRVGAADDFFNLGGHSVKAVSLAARLSSTFGFRISPRAVFERRTPARLAEHISTHLPGAEGVTGVQPNGRKEGNEQ